MLQVLPPIRITTSSCLTTVILSPYKNKALLIYPAKYRVSIQLWCQEVAFVLSPVPLTQTWEKWSGMLLIEFLCKKISPAL